MRSVFLDHQSSTPLLPEVLDAMLPYLRDAHGNPSALHQFGLRARKALGTAREQFASLINAESPDTIIFTSGGTEAVNLAVKGAAWSAQSRGKHLVLSAGEHPAVLNSVAFLEQNGYRATRVPLDGEGRVDPAQVAAAISHDTILVCTHLANHDVGTIQPLAKIAAVTQEKGVPLFVDAVSAAGWLQIDVQELGADLLALSPHRFYGPKGVGALYRNRRARLTSLLHGGDQEQGRRAGTENVAAIAGGGVAAELVQRQYPGRVARVTELQRRFWEHVRNSVTYLRLNGPEPGLERIPTQLNLSAEFTEGEGQMLSLDMAGVAVASGTSCVSRAFKVSPVLEAMGVPRAVALASIIVSLGAENTLEEIDYAAATYAKVIERLRGLSPLWDEFRAGKIDSEVQPGGIRDRAGSEKDVG